LSEIIEKLNNDGYKMADSLLKLEENQWKQIEIKTSRRLVHLIRTKINHEDILIPEINTD
jgi:hypothetical protein